MMPERVTAFARAQRYSTRTEGTVEGEVAEQSVDARSILHKRRSFTVRPATKSSDETCRLVLMDEGAWAGNVSLFDV